MTMSQEDFLADALSCGSALIGEASPGQQLSVRNDAWSAFCQTLLTPANIQSPELKTYTERLRDIDRIYSASLVYASAQPALRRKSLAMYFTPPPLSEYVLDRVERFGVDFGTGRFIDPSAGGASFIGPIASRMRENGATPQHVLASLTGIEIDPALAEFARAAAASVIEQDATDVVLTGNGLKLGELGTYDAVIGNPPYRVLSPTERKRMPLWAKETLGAYANLYALFIMRGLQLLHDGGLLAFLVPTSFIVGQYFGHLRHHLTSQSTVLAIDTISQRKKVFRDVSQDVCLLICRKGITKHGSYRADARMVDKSMKWRQQDKYLMDSSSEKPWYAAPPVAKDSTAQTLEDFGYQVRCGSIVHNRDKGLSSGVRRKRRNAVPLVWGHVIKPGQNVEPASRRCQPGEGPVTYVSTLRSTPPLTCSSIVLQRTNSGDQVRRVRAGIVDQSWIDKYGGFYGENHVVIVSPLPETSQKISLRLLWRVLSSEAVDKRLRPLLSSNSINITALRKLPLPNFRYLHRRGMMDFSEAVFEAILEKAYSS